MKPIVIVFLLAGVALAAYLSVRHQQAINQTAKNLETNWQAQGIKADFMLPTTPALYALKAQQMLYVVDAGHDTPIAFADVDKLVFHDRPEVSHDNSNARGASYVMLYTHSGQKIQLSGLKGKAADAEKIFQQHGVLVDKLAIKMDKQ